MTMKNSNGRTAMKQSKPVQSDQWFCSLTPESLGSAEFKSRYQIKYAYLSGAMYQGIASKELVVAMAQKGLLGFLGTGGRDIQAVENDIIAIQAELAVNEVFGVNLISQMENPEAELNTVAMYVKHGVNIVEASAYMQMTLALVYYRVSGLSRAADGTVQCAHKIIAKLSRPEVAEKFLSPPALKMVQTLLAENKISKEQSELSQLIPMCSDICVEADSGGHTDRGIPSVLLPSIQSLRLTVLEKYAYQDAIHVGLAGGIGVPQSAASAFMMGADFILTGSINQCTVEAATSDEVKDMLQSINVQDTDYAPAGDMFEIGAKVQVLKKGNFFAARANKLYDLYSQYRGWDDIPEATRKQIEQKYFQQGFAAVWAEVEQYHLQKGNSKIIEKAHKCKKHQLALVFKKYFSLTTRYALQGMSEKRIDFQVHTGPALGAFNQWVKDTPLADWRNRRVAEVAEQLMCETARFMSQEINRLMTASRQQDQQP